MSGGRIVDRRTRREPSRDLAPIASGETLTVDEATLDALRRVLERHDALDVLPALGVTA